MEKEKVIKYAKKYWWVLLLVVLWIVGTFFKSAPAPRDYVKEANNIQEKIIESSDVEKLTANLDSLARLLDVMKKVNDVDSNFVNARNALDTIVANRDAIHDQYAHKIKLKNLFGRGARCYPVSELIKKSMNNPDSYEFVDSDFKVVDNDTFLVTETCRGTNSFGGVITVTYQAVVTIDGDVTSLKQL